MNQFIQFVKQLWASVRSNPYFVAFEGGASGALVSWADDCFQQGHWDFSSTGLHKLLAVMLIGGYAAVRMLYRPAPGTNPNQKP